MSGEYDKKVNFPVTCHSSLLNRQVKFCQLKASVTDPPPPPSSCWFLEYTNFQSPPPPSPIFSEPPFRVSKDVRSHPPPPPNTNMGPCYNFLSVYQSTLYFEDKFISGKETMNLPGKMRKIRRRPPVRSYIYCLQNRA